MFGPGTGHNIVRFLEYFKNQNEHKLTYYHYNSEKHFSHSKYQPEINFISPYSIFKLVREIRNNQDLLWIHNWTPWPILFIVWLFAKKTTIINFNVWSESIPNMMKSSSLKAKFYRWFLNSCNTLQCTWFSTLNILKEQGFKNTALLRWGMVEEKFTSIESHIPSNYTLNFCETLESGKYRFFFPKSVSGGNRHDLIIEASKKLTENGFTNFKVYFWLGNFNREEQLDLLKSRIEKHGLTQQIEFVHHDFVSHQDIHYLWDKMDCGLQVLDADQLSTSFQEPQLYLKEIIASDIPSYQLFKQEFGVNIELIKNNVEGLYDSMKKLLEGNKTTEKELYKRQRIINEHYRFNSNMPKILNYFSLLKK